MEVQRKVTSFVTRGSGEAAELLVFWHAGSGVQVPAGTVEKGESFEAAALREAEEETGLPDLELVARLGSKTHLLPEGEGVIVRQVALRTRPDGPETHRRLGNVMVRVCDRREGFVRVVHEERDLDAPEDEEPLVFARFEGWVPEDALRFTIVRECYHFRANGSTPEQWQQLENEQFLLHLRWWRLTPKPHGLISGHQEWLDHFYDRLLGAER